MKLIFASQNQNKLKEVKNTLPSFNITSLEEENITGHIAETGSTLKENAQIKAQTIWEKTGANCFADDTGLLVEALENRPGVYSARYAGEGCTAMDNMQLVLNQLKGKSNRKARFITCICLIWEGKTYFFEGLLKGEILSYLSGNDGFGYDPIFRPEGYSLSLAEISLEEKNKISHRGIALRALAEFLEGITNGNI